MKRGSFLQFLKRLPEFVGWSILVSNLTDVSDAETTHTDGRWKDLPERFSFKTKYPQNNPKDTENLNYTLLLELTELTPLSTWPYRKNHLHNQKRKSLNVVDFVLCTSCNSTVGVAPSVENCQPKKIDPRVVKTKKPRSFHPSIFPRLLVISHHLKKLQ